MTPKQMLALGTAFAAYLRFFRDCFAQDRTAEHLHSYCRGLLSDIAQHHRCGKKKGPHRIAPMNVSRAGSPSGSSGPGNTRWCRK